jgi:hypothetical protein
MALSTPGPSNPETIPNATFSLENILGNHENLEHPKYREEDKPLGGWDEEFIEKPAAEGFCIECEGGLPFFCSRDRRDELICEVQINRLRCSVRIARIIIAKCASRRNTGKVLEKDM